MSDLKFRNNGLKLKFTNAENEHIQSKPQRKFSVLDNEKIVAQSFDGNLFNTKPILNSSITISESINLCNDKSQISDSTTQCNTFVQTQLPKNEPDLRRKSLDCFGSKKEQVPLLRGIFSYDGKSIDLELYDNIIRWTYVYGKIK